MSIVSPDAVTVETIAADGKGAFVPSARGRKDKFDTAVSVSGSRC